MQRAIEEELPHRYQRRATPPPPPAEGQFLVPRALWADLMGVCASQLDQLRLAAGVGQMYFEPAPSNNGDRILHFAAPNMYTVEIGKRRLAAKLQQAQAAAEQRRFEERRVTEVWAAPAAVMGWMVGPAGIYIDEIREVSSAAITLRVKRMSQLSSYDGTNITKQSEKEPNDAEVCAAVISGPRTAVEIAKHMLTRHYAEMPRQQRRFVPRFPAKAAVLDGESVCLGMF